MEESTETVEVQESGEVEAKEAETGSFFSGLNDEFKSNPTAEKFKNADSNAVFKSYTELQSMIGRDKIVKPNGNDESDVKRFWNELGVPDDPEKYELGRDEWAEKQGYDQSVMKKIAHGANLTPDQARKVEELYLQDIRSSMERNEEQTKEQRAEMEQELRREWGPKFDEKTALAERVVDKFARSEATAGQLKNMMKDNPELAATLSDIGSQFAENRIGDFKAKSFSVSPQEAKDRIDRIYSDQSHPYFNDDNKKLHDDAVNEMNELMKIANGM